MALARGQTLSCVASPSTSGRLAVCPGQSRRPCFAAPARRNYRCQRLLRKHATPEDHDLQFQQSLAQDWDDGTADELDALLYEVGLTVLVQPGLQADTWVGRLWKCVITASSLS